jgi:hypothetical protein
MAGEAKKAGVIDEVVARIEYVSPPIERREEKTTIKSQQTRHGVPALKPKNVIKKRR